MNDYYSILGINKTADAATIKTAYRALAKKYHPDTSVDPAADTKFKEINNAYDILKDPAKRQQYDMPSSINSNMFNWTNTSAGNSFNDIFNNIFGQQRGNLQKNSDIQFQYVITLEDAYTGCERVVNVNYDNGENKDLHFIIPKGVTVNTRIKLQDQGPVANPNLPPGDVYIIILISRHCKFLCNGIDLIISQEINSIDAMVGCNIIVTTLDNKTLTVEIPAGTQPYSKIRIKNKGMPIYNTHNFGDLYLDINLVTPTGLTTAQKEILINLKKTLSNS